jgi:16S rRNA (uracil1498-N3)-methyltransferase
MQIYYSFFQKDGKAFIDQEEARHLTRVLRKQEGASLRVTDGKGQFFEGQFFPDKGDFSHIVINKRAIISHDKKPLVWLLIAPTKNIDRIEWLVEKCTELGLAGLTPVYCQRSERKIIKTERLKRIALAAMKQSQRAFLPEIQDGIKFSELFKNLPHGPRLIAHCAEDVEKKDLRAFGPYKDTHYVLIGPEGDFTPEEIQLAIANQFQPVTLGETRLRTETAGLLACAILNYPS